MTNPKQDHEDPEKDPAAEWGERIEHGKQIARGGKEEGDVPGATEQSSEEEEE